MSKSKTKWSVLIIIVAVVFALTYPATYFFNFDKADRTCMQSPTASSFSVRFSPNPLPNFTCTRTDSDGSEEQFDMGWNPTPD